MGVREFLELIVKLSKEEGLTVLFSSHDLLNAKFMAALTVINRMFFALGFLVMGFGLIIIGIPPTSEEFMRIIFFILLSSSTCLFNYREHGVLRIFSPSPLLPFTLSLLL